MSYFTTKMSPQHFNRIKPGAVSGKVKKHQSTGCPTHDSLNFTILVGTAIVPSDIHGMSRVLV